MKTNPLPWLLFLCGWAATALAFSPELSRIEPRGGQVGTTVRIELIGKRLFDPQDLLFYEKGLSVVGIEPQEGGKRCFATLRIPPRARLGEYPLRLVTKEGLTELRTFWVGQFPTVTETMRPGGKRELNDTFQDAQLVATDVTVQGITKREDQDYFKVRMKKGQRLSAEVEGMRLGRVMFDPLVSILDPSGKELARNDDSPLLGRDCAVSIICPSDGDYRIYLRESALEGSSQSQYRLHIGHFPRPMRMEPFAVRPGETTTFTFHGDPVGPIPQAVADPANHHQIFAEHAGYLSPSGFPLHEISPDSILEESGVLKEELPLRFYKFEGKKDRVLIAEIIARPLGSKLDSVMALHQLDQNGKPLKGKALAFNDDAKTNSADSRIRQRLPANAFYRLTVRDQLNEHSPEHFFHLKVSYEKPAVRATLVSPRQDNDQLNKLVQVPRGGHALLVANLNRTSYTGPVLLQQNPDLPSSLTIDLPANRKNQSKLPFLFRADPDAPLGGYLLPINLSNKSSKVLGQLHETIAHVKINNLGTYHRTEYPHLAVAVIEKAPFSFTNKIRGALPKDGFVEIDVEFDLETEPTGPIQIRVPYRPRGVSAPNVVEIPKGQTTATVKIDANGQAEPGLHHLAITATVPTKTGDITLSSDFLELQIQEPTLRGSIRPVKATAGTDTTLIIDLDRLQPFSGNALLTLGGLPKGVTAPASTFGQEETTLEVPLTLERAARVGQHRNIFAVVQVPTPHGPAKHVLARSSLLRILPATLEASKDPKPEPAPK